MDRKSAPLGSNRQRLEAPCDPGDFATRSPAVHESALSRASNFSFTGPGSKRGSLWITRGQRLFDLAQRVTHSGAKICIATRPLDRLPRSFPGRCYIRHGLLPLYRASKPGIVLAYRHPITPKANPGMAKWSPFLPPKCQGNELVQ
jgi:hypothetical protein